MFAKAILLLGFAAIVQSQTLCSCNSLMSCVEQRKQEQRKLHETCVAQCRTNLPNADAILKCMNTERGEIDALIKEDTECFMQGNCGSSRARRQLNLSVNATESTHSNSTIQASVATQTTSGHTSTQQSTNSTSIVHTSTQPSTNSTTIVHSSTQLSTNSTTVVHSITQPSTNSTTVVHSSTQPSTISTTSLHSSTQSSTNSTSVAHTSTQPSTNATTLAHTTAQTSINATSVVQTSAQTSATSTSAISTSATSIATPARAEVPVNPNGVAQVQTQTNGQVNLDLIDVQRYDDCVRSCSTAQIGNGAQGINPGIQQLVGKHLRGIEECSTSLNCNVNLQAIAQTAQNCRANNPNLKQQRQDIRKRYCTCLREATGKTVAECQERIG